MENKVREWISWTLAYIIGMVIITAAMGIVFYVINCLLAYALGVPMLGYMQLCALGLALGLASAFIKWTIENV